jgi:hypothetical protein
VQLLTARKFFEVDAMVFCSSQSVGSFEVPDKF